MRWYGEHQFDLQKTACWQIGERFIAIKRAEREWTIWNRETAADSNQPITFTRSYEQRHGEVVPYSRYMVTKTSDTLMIEPSLADRAVVATPSTPLVVMPNEKIEVYVSTPLWMSVFLAESDRLIADIPFWRPSDSWFGPSTMTGDLCYSKYTDARVDLAQLELHSCRAITEVSLHNDLDEPLRVEKLNLPVPSLKLYVNQKKEFWTDRVSVSQREEHGKLVSLVSQSQPSFIKDDDEVFESRELSKKPSFLSSIKNLVG